MNINELLNIIFSITTTGIISIMVYLIKNIHKHDIYITENTEKLKNNMETINEIYNKINNLQCSFHREELMNNTKSTALLQRDVINIDKALQELKSKLNDFQDYKLNLAELLSEIKSEIKTINNNLITLQGDIKLKINVINDELNNIKDDINKIKY